VPLLRLRSDEQLVSLLRAGNEDAFRVIHDRYRARMLAYARQMLASTPADAEDIVQEIFVRAYAGLRADRRDLALRAWLYRIAHNRCIDELRRPQAVAVEVIEDLGEAPGPDPHARVEQREALRRLIADVQRLPEQQRSALLMRELGGMPYVDLSGALGVSVPAIKSLLVRARVGLAQAGEARDTACSSIREDLIVAHDRGVRASGRARRHMRDCPHCRQFRTEVQGMSRRFALLVPALGPLAVAAKLCGIGLGGLGGGGGAAAGTGTSAAAGSTAAAAAGSTAAAAAGSTAAAASTTAAAAGTTAAAAGSTAAVGSVGTAAAGASAVAGTAAGAGGTAAAGGAVAGGAAAAGGAATAGGAAAAGGAAVAGTTAAASGGALAAAGAGHVAAIVAATVVAAGGAIGIQHEVATGSVPPAAAHATVRGSALTAGIGGASGTVTPPAQTAGMRPTLALGDATSSSDTSGVAATGASPTSTVVRRVTVSRLENANGASEATFHAPQTGFPNQTSTTDPTTTSTPGSTSTDPTTTTTPVTTTGSTGAVPVTDPSTTSSSSSDPTSVTTEPVTSSEPASGTPSSTTSTLSPTIKTGKSTNGGGSALVPASTGRSSGGVAVRIRGWSGASHRRDASPRPLR
jgi:RNA polymerase sigma factor (sigma-70 family)